MLGTYQITIEDSVKASSFVEALEMVIDRIKTEETIATVEFMPTGETREMEIQSDDPHNFDG